jgi:hypothetical protein
MMEQNAKEILLSLLDEARVPLIWRTVSSDSDSWSAFATVTGEDSRAQIFVKTYDTPEINIVVHPFGHEFVAVAPDLRTVVDRAAEFVRRWVKWRLITFKDLFPDIADEVDDYTYAEFADSLQKEGEAQ